MSLIRILSEGPEVSLSGSPIVSPITAALWAFDPFGPSDFACSETPACSQSKPSFQKILIFGANIDMVRTS